MAKNYGGMSGGGAASHRRGAHFDDTGYTTHSSKASSPITGSESYSFPKPMPGGHCNPRLSQFENIRSGGQPAGKTKSF